ncbi:hypothetical protein AB7X32_21385 [Morganella morganii]|uniref:hypothetical protein n=1 Tax=Morganella morganii TaxID=582 RepID=UPI0034E57EDE
MPIIIGIIILIFLIFALGPLLLEAIGNLLSVVVGIAILVGLVFLGVAFPPLGILMLLAIIGYAIYEKTSSGSE